MPTPPMAQWVVFGLDARRIAIPLAAVERVVRAVEITPLPQAPSMVIGVINVRGAVLPVMNVRRKFHLPERAVVPTDHFLIARTARGPIVLVIDTTYGVVERPAADTINANTFAQDSDHITGALPLPDGLVLIHDIDRLLSEQAANDLKSALSNASPPHQHET
jgi:purine-binding chemotaxis protein CheW